MSNHIRNGQSPEHGSGRKSRGFMSRLKMKYATGLMIASGFMGIGQTATAAPSKSQNKNKSAKSISKGKFRQAATAALGKAKKVAGGNFALLNKYKQELQKYGAAKLEGYSKKMNGVASWYGGFFHGRLTASGRRFSTYAHMAAHKSLPFGTILRVTNPANGKSTLVEVLDRGPYVADRMLDLSKATADELGFQDAGTAQVQAEILKMGNLPYEIEAPFNAAEMKGEAIRHKMDLAGIEGYDEIGNAIAGSERTPAIAEASGLPSPSGSFLYNVGFHRILPSMQQSADAVATSIREAVEGFRGATPGVA
jgi:rare lipoprotein A (peptidoglycan hydrolase)